MTHDSEYIIKLSKDIKVPVRSDSPLSINERGNLQLKLPPELSKAIMEDSKLKPGEFDIIDGCIHCYGTDGIYSITSVEAFISFRTDLTEEQKQSYRQIAAEQSALINESESE